ncbi:MAG: hypothetical protein AB7U35_13885 [Sphingobium sp.]
MPRSRKRRPAGKATPETPFNPIPLRERHDGWTADRQIAFIDALAASGCVTDAARTVGMSLRSAYRLRAHPGAGGFRLAWDNALEFAIQHLQDAVLSRAIKGVPIPHYYMGKKVGEHRRYDERLAQFLLRTRAPAFYGRPAEQRDIAASSHLYAVALARAILHIEQDGAEYPAPGEERDAAADPAMADEEAPASFDGA